MITINENKKVLKRIPEIKSELSKIDIKRIRPLAEGDTQYLDELNAQAEKLRDELQGLLSG